MLEEFLRVGHTGAVALYIGGAIIVTILLRQPLRLIPPAQAGIVGGIIGTYFTIISWIALATWVSSGYWLLERGGWDDFRSPQTLFIDGELLESGYGWMLVLMVACWFGMAINGVMIMLFRPLLTRRLAPGESPESVERLERRMAFAGRAIEGLAWMNLLLALAATLAGHRFFEHVYMYR
jgi:uncharacterized membrane protein